jgi:hypothetical protein
MELNMLLELSATILDLLIKRYKTGQLTYEEFVNNTELKISFIKDNFNYITTMAHKYPKAKLILAHCARGFASWTTVEKVAELSDYENIWFDLAAICESPSIFQIIKKTGKKRTVETV